MTDETDCQRGTPVTGFAAGEARDALGPFGGEDVPRVERPAASTRGRMRTPIPMRGRTRRQRPEAPITFPDRERVRLDRSGRPEANLRQT